MMRCWSRLRPEALILSNGWSNAGTALLLLACAALAGSGAPAAAEGEEAGAAPPPQWQMLDERCSKCHNGIDWAGGIAFDTLSADNIHADAEVWEKAIRKLRGRLMPPPGETQPDQQSIDSFVSWMEGKLDGIAAAHPDPGYVGLHRLNRTEYAREIDRLLGLSVDVKALLPKDVSSEGFDNVASSGFGCERLPRENLL
jgi:hypothetical protein